MYRARVDYDESQEIQEPWFTNTGVKKRVARWESLSKKSKYDKPFYTKTFWSEWGNKLRENIDNEFERDGQPTRA